LVSMEQGIKGHNFKRDLPEKSIIDLLEEVRLTSLNLAIASAKFKAFNLKQDQIKKKLSEMVALVLESVQILSNFLVQVGIKRNQQLNPNVEIDHQKLEENLQKIAEFINSITNGFIQDSGLK